VYHIAHRSSKYRSSCTKLSLAVQVYDQNGRHAAPSSYTDLPREVSELQKIFPNADPEALINALSVSDNNIDIAKAVSQCSTALL